VDWQVQRRYDASMGATAVTKHGREMRERIVRAAAALIAEQGAAGTSLDDVRAATGASKSQLYHYFGDKHGLVEAVVDHQCVTVLSLQARALASVDDWDGLEGWAEAMTSIVEEQCARGGCPIGTLAAALSDTDERLRTSLSEAFRAWSDAIRGALGRLRANGLISAHADLDALTTSMLASIQGGLLLAKTSRERQTASTRARRRHRTTQGSRPGDPQTSPLSALLCVGSELVRQRTRHPDLSVRAEAIRHGLGGSHAAALVQPLGV
jgi:TetR/AcrR family transcriptional repressor of nem operon